MIRNFAVGIFSCLLLILHANLFSRQIIKNEDGIPVVLNPKKPPASIKGPTQLVLEEDLRIGDPAAKGERFFGKIFAVREDPDKNIYILDENSQSVKLFDKSGKFLKTIGTPDSSFKGLTQPYDLQIIPGKGLGIFHKETLSLFTFQGSHIKDIKGPVFTKNPSFDTRGNIIAAQYILNIQSEKITGRLLKKSYKSEIKKFGPDFIPYQIFAVLDFPLPLQKGTFPPFPGQLFFALQSNDDVVWGNNTQYEFMIMNQEARILRKFRKDYDPLKISEAGKKRIVGQLGMNADISKMDFPDFYPAFRDLRIDDKGKILVLTYEGYEKGEYSYDVFQMNGTLITKIVLKHPILEWKNGNLYAAEEHKDQTSFCVIRYKAVWK